MPDTVFRVALPVFWLLLIAGVAINRHRLQRQLGHDPIVARPWRRNDTAIGCLERTLSICTLVVTVDIALNAVAPGRMADILALHIVRSSRAAGSLGLILLAVGVVQSSVAVLQMGASWRIGVDQRTSGPLVSRGLFSRVRHPIYGGMLLATLGLAALTADLLSISVAAAAWVGLPVQARLEEAFLLSRHPQEYPPYLKKTGRFWPKLFLA
jgi:protein-S-isoprenylcysteine O-methyltransferase Ste14